MRDCDYFSRLVTALHGPPNMRFQLLVRLSREWLSPFLKPTRRPGRAQPRSLRVFHGNSAAIEA
jgi:hypothetical protein